MHRRTFILMIILLCLCAQLVAAQDANGLANFLDQRATAAGLPVGDGKISTAEQNLGNAVMAEANNFSNTLDNFSQASAQNAAWINKVDAATQGYNEQLAAAQASIEAAANQYSHELETLKSQAPAGEDAQAILNGIGAKNSVDPLTNSASDAYGAQVMNAVYADTAGKSQILQDASANYNAANAGDSATQGQPIAKALSEYAAENAALGGIKSLPLDQQYILNASMSEIDDVLAADPLKPSNGGTLEKSQETMLDWAKSEIGDYFDKYEGGYKHKATVKRHIDHLIEIMVPSANLPINGNWRVSPYKTTTTGQCIDYYGDNDGPGDTNPNDDPGEPLCGYINAGSLPFITWQGGIHPYLLGTSSMYGQVPMRTTFSVKNSQGKTTRSVKVSTFTEYEVISPTQIRVHTFMQEEGGCTINANYTLELVTPDESVCPEMNNLPVPHPVEQVEPPEESIGPFTVAQPLVTDETECNASNALPEISDISLFGQSDGSIKMDYGSGTQTLFSDGRDYYDYDSGSGKTREQISLTLNDDHQSGGLLWSIKDGDGNTCSQSMDFALPGSANDPSASDNATDTNQPSTDDTSGTFTITVGSYNVTWKSLPGTQCPDALKAKVPGFTTATITTSGSSFTVTGGDKQYALINQAGQYMYTGAGDDGSMSFMGIYRQEDNGHLSGIYSLTSGDGGTCASTLDFAPA